MKQLLTLIAAVLSFSTAFAQVDVKLNVFNTILKSPDISAEFAVKDNLGIEPYIGFGWPSLRVNGSKYSGKGMGYGISGKYYFNPEAGIDKIYAGVYLRGGSTTFQKDTVGETISVKRNRLMAGALLGYKWVSRNDVIVDISSGFGRKIYSIWDYPSGEFDVSKVPFLNLDFFINFSIGYRFGGGESASTDKKKKKF